MSKDEVHEHCRENKRAKYDYIKANSNKNDSISLQNLKELLSNDVKSLKWTKVERENLDVDYTILFSSEVATELFQKFENEFQYFTGDFAKVKVFGKWHNLPRKQVTYGDEGLTYKYSGVVTLAQPWPPTLFAVKELICQVTGHNFNFVLVNRYNDGSDKMGEHKDGEKELDPDVPIASLSLGQTRDFYFKHQDTRGKFCTRDIDKVNLKLENGSLLLMNKPTNSFWYHALPPRKKVTKPRINLTFRKIIKN